MKNTQAWGWLTAGVLALGLNGIYQDGGAAWAHRVFDKTVARLEARVQPVVAVALAMGDGDRVVAKTESLATQVGLPLNETASSRIAPVMARVQNKLVRTQMRLANIGQVSARQEAALARMEASEVRMEARMARVRVTPVALVMEDASRFACSRSRSHWVR